MRANDVPQYPPTDVATCIKQMAKAQPETICADGHDHNSHLSLRERQHSPILFVDEIILKSRNILFTTLCNSSLRSKYTPRPAYYNFLFRYTLF